jgi:hypothetical protein
MNPSDYTLDQVIVHDIPEHRTGEAGPGPLLSDLVDPLVGDLRDYFQGKIRDTLLDKGHLVQRDPEGQSGAPELIAKQLRGETGLLDSSRQLAEQLYKTQSGRNSTGLLVVLSGAATGKSALAVMKLERQQGVRVMREMISNGQLHFNMSHLRDLMLDERTRVFKAGLFTLAADGSVEGVVSDEQRGSKRDGVATFFLSKFLGCELSGDAQAITKVFFTTTLTWINERIDDPDSQAKYLLALIAEMNSEDRDIDPGEFARRNLDLEDGKEFLQYLAASGVPVTVFEKDINLIKPQLRMMRINIENNIVVLVPPDQADKVSFDTDESDAQTQITSIRGALKGFSGR